MGTGLVTTSKISKGVNMLKLARFFFSVGFVAFAVWLALTMPWLVLGCILLGLAIDCLHRHLGR